MEVWMEDYNIKSTKKSKTLLTKFIKTYIHTKRFYSLICYFESTLHESRYILDEYFPIGNIFQRKSKYILFFHKTELS